MVAVLDCKQDPEGATVERRACLLTSGSGIGITYGSSCLVGPLLLFEV